jgi:GNAT superfamily N-acetyltransferase
MREPDVRQVRTPRQRLEFIRTAWSFYENDPHWVPPLIADQKRYLDPKKGVFYDHGEAELFVAERAGRPVGRISGHVNYLYDELYGKDTGFFGFFECENDSGTAQALLNAAETFVQSRGMRRILGPMSFGVYDEIGILIDGFDSDPYVMNGHNPPYYADLLQAAGYGKAVDWYAYHGYTAARDRVNPRLFKVRDRVVSQPDLDLRTLDLSSARTIRREADIINRIFLDAWRGNWGHVPWTRREFERLVEAVKKIAISELSYIVEVRGRPVGFALSIADANVAAKMINGKLFPFGFLTFLRNLKRTDRFRHILMGVLEEHRNQGIEIAMYAELVERCCELGYREIEMSLVVENNHAMRNSLKHFPLEIYKTYRVFEKQL